MKKIYLILMVTMALTSCEIINSNSNAVYVGVNEKIDEKIVTYHSVNPIKTKFDQISTLTDITSVVQGVFTYDNINDYFILETNLGITVVDVQSGTVVTSFTGITEIEFNPNDGMLYGLHWNDSTKNLFFANAEISTGEITLIKEIENISGWLQGNSTFDYDLNRYCFIADSVIIIDINEGQIINKFFGIEEIEYDQNSGKLVGVSDDDIRKLLRADILTGEIEVLGELNINSVVQGVSTFDQENNYYIIKSEGGLTVIDVDEVSIVNSFEGLTEIEWLNK